MQILFASLLAMGMTVLLIPPLMRNAGRLGVLDQPGTRKVHVTPIPRVGGIAMAIGILIALLMWSNRSQLLVTYCSSMVVLLVFGVIDDRIALTPRWKLLGQVIAALIVMTFAHVNVGSVHHLQSHEVPVWLSYPLTLLFIVGVTNAINLADGLDGLAGGATLLCLTGLALLAFTGGSDFVAFAAVITIGAVLGFLRYNTHPARIFMGDAGSQLLGFSVAVMSLILTQDKDMLYSASLPLLLLGVPVIDTLTVMIERMLDGRSPFAADRTHVHHRLLSLGFKHHEAVMIIYGAQSIMLIMAWYLRYASDVIIVAVFVVLAMVIVAALRLAGKMRWRWRPDDEAVPYAVDSWLQCKLRWLYAGERLNRLMGYVIGASVIVYGCLVVINSISVPPDIRVLAGVAALIVLLSLVVRRAGRETGWLERAALYTSVLIAVYLDRLGTINPFVQFIVEGLLFGVLIAGIVVRMSFRTDRRFRITPLDVLVLIAAIALPNLPGSMLSSYALGGMIWKTLLLFYAVENLSVTAGVQWRMLAGGTLMFLSAVALRAAV